MVCVPKVKVKLLSIQLRENTAAVVAGGKHAAFGSRTTNAAPDVQYATKNPKDGHLLFVIKTDVSV